MVLGRPFTGLGSGKVPVPRRVVVSVVVGATNADTAWYYPSPKDAATEIKDRVAFWNGVTVTP